MLPYKKIIKLALPLVVVIAGCTKLNESLNSRLTNAQTSTALGAQGTGLLLKAAYADIAGTFSSQDQVFSLEENTTDESLVPTRGGDWDDNGVWRVLHAHTWNADHQQILNVFNSLNKLNFDATNVLAFNPTKGQAAEARFLRAFALYYILDLYGQVPFRNPGDNLLNAPEVKSGADAINFIISELTAIIPDLDPANPITAATPDAANVLLMHCLLQKGAFINRAAPTFADADMQQVITLGNAIINSHKYSYTPNYFDNFSVNNSSTSKEAIFAYPNQSGVSVNHANIEARWMMTLHYNSYTPNNPNAGWNGFSTISDFYNTFSPTGVTTFSRADSTLDQRIGHRYNVNSTPYSGIRPGFLVGQQYNEAGVALKDRKGNPLAYTPQIASNMIETGSNLEVTGIRVVKYVPDFTNSGKYYSGPAGNWQMLYRYPDVVLMVAEAKMRAATPDVAGALTLINGLRAARGATPVASMPLVNPNNVEDPNTLLAERGRELYWESFRRTDLIRFGVYLKSWQYKPSDDPKNLVFPIPSQALAANPNLKQNPNY
ncbi:MAG: RagB/SusD family nutrient uptake outer membrane protein [Ginsengibacter sp.]